MSDKFESKFCSIGSASIFIKKAVMESDRNKSVVKNYYWGTKYQSQFIFGNYDYSSLVCWRNCLTSGYNCYYVFGIKAYTADEGNREYYYRFVEPYSNT